MNKTPKESKANVPRTIPWVRDPDGDYHATHKGLKFSIVKSTDAGFGLSAYAVQPDGSNKPLIAYGRAISWYGSKWKCEEAAEEILAEQIASRWQDRVIEATHGNQSQFGTIVIAALGRNEDEQAPKFGTQASVTSDGYVMCDFVDKNGRGHMGAFVGAKSDVIGNTKNCAAHLKLNAEDKAEFYAVIAKWLGLGKGVIV